ncbi:MAG: redoxin domain-containing protein [Akkermansia sp.]|nr:redoxin domain-containing protein [Akkermansia sp.]
MRHTILLCALLLGIFCWALPQQALADDTPASEVSKKKKKKKKKSKKKSKDKEADEATEQPTELSTVASLLKDAEYLTKARPNLQAKYFIVLKSASWCGPCRAEMPKIAAEYANIRKSGQVELILASQDQDVNAALQFVNSNNGKFPVIPNGKMPQLPNMPQTPGIPWAVFFDANGKMLASKHGGAVLQWRDFTIGNAEDVPLPEETADEENEDETPRVHEAISKAKFFNGKPSKKADYYVYLHSASWCGPCKALMPQIVKEYKKMKRKGVEIILMGHDKTEDEAKAYLKSYKAKFAGILDNTPTAKALPGYAPANGIPNATIVDKHGQIITSGHGNIVLEWEQHCK